MVKIAAVCTAYNEDDILPWTTEHLLNELVDEIFIEMPEAGKTYETARQSLGMSDSSRVHFKFLKESFHNQPKSIDWLASLAKADWIIPFDADEFWYSSDPSKTIREALESLPESIQVVTATMYQQHDWWNRELAPKPMPKVAYRYHPGAHIGPGNHTVNHPGNGETVGGLLSIREIQYRGFEHFARKIEERNRTIDPSFGPEFGNHHKHHAGKSTGELASAWNDMMQVPTIWDPIPSTITPPDHLAPPVELLPLPKLFEKMKAEPNDIAGHMDRLAELAYDKRVLELGVNTGMSTLAFEVGKVAYLQSVDIASPRWRPELTWSDSFWQGDSLDFVHQVYEFDVIFIDTSHTYRQTLEELKAYYPKVAPGGCLVLHDTVSCPDGVGRALRHWLHTVNVSRVEHYEHSNGLAVIWV